MSSSQSRSQEKVSTGSSKSKYRHKESKGREKRPSEDDDQRSSDSKDKAKDQTPTHSKPVHKREEEPEAGFNDIVALREQIMGKHRRRMSGKTTNAMQSLANVRIAFPYYYKNGNKDFAPEGDVNFEIVTLIRKEDRGSTFPYRSEVLWVPCNKVFLAGAKGRTAPEALDNLLDLSAHVLGDLRDNHELKGMRSFMGPNMVENLGSFAAKPTGVATKRTDDVAETKD